jgi:hypothetical protein
MTEAFLHYLWGHRLCYQAGLTTHDGQPFEIIHPGIPNGDAGPDFFNAKIKIGSTLWAGNVEIHIRERDWERHGHHLDPAYDNVILHVVQEHQAGTVNHEGRPVPVWEMQYEQGLLYRYNRLLAKPGFIACEQDLDQISPFEMTQWLERMLVERIESRSKDVKRYLQWTNNDWDEVFYLLLSRAFGFGTNAEPFERLARLIPLKVLLKHANDVVQLEAFLLGQAGLLEKAPEDAYTRTLKKEYRFLNHKYQLKPMDESAWHFLRLRPSNFPTIRLVQLARLIHETRGQFGDFVHSVSLKKWKRILNVSTSEYWETHFKPGISSKQSRQKKVGKGAIDLLLINAIVPYCYLFAKYKGLDDMSQKSLQLMAQLPPEQNHIIEQWGELGHVAADAAQSQAMIFLKKSYCNHKKCLSCRIGHKIISS